MVINRSQNQTLFHSSLYLPKPYFIGSQIVHIFKEWRTRRNHFKIL